MATHGLPPLPPGWTEHVGMMVGFISPQAFTPGSGPAGQPYYYHAASQQSTYVRPFPAFTPPQPVAEAAAKKKKEKPLVKVPIPGTEWLRVKTTEGNTFYTHKGRKESVWIMPEEIREAVEALNRSEEHAMEQTQLQQLGADDTVTKCPQQEENVEVKVAKEVELGLKRKAAEPVLLEEVVITKKIRKEDEEDNDEEAEGEDVSEEEEWQREAAEQLAAEAEDERARQEEEARAAMEKEEAETKKLSDKPQFNIPDRVDLSLEEAKALFKVSSMPVKLNFQAHQWYRLYSEKKTSIPFTLGIPRYPFSCLTHDMYSSRLYLRVVRPLTNIAETVLANSGNKMLRKRQRMRTLERSLIACSLNRSRALGPLGLTSDELGKRIGVSMVGGGMIGNARNDSRSSSRSWEKVCALSDNSEACALRETRKTCYC